MVRTYVAYGSNINVEWMNDLCPNAKIVSTGYILNARVVYRGTGLLNLELGFGYGKVPVLVWDIDEEAEVALDGYERYPDYYGKKEVCVCTEKGVVTRMVYIMTPEYEVQRRAPKDDYVERVKGGYRAFDFPLAVLDDAMKEVLND